MKKDSSTIFILIFLLGLSLLMIFGSGSKLGHSFRAIGGSILAPIERIAYQSRSNFLSKFSFLSYWRNSSVRIEQLEKQNRELIALCGKTESYQKENADMRRLLGAPLPQNWRFLPAKVIGWENGGILIDKGSTDKINEGLIVVYENILIGKISFAGENFSRVETLISDKLKIPVVVKDFRQKGLLARGVLSAPAGKIYLERVLQSERIMNDDFVLTSGEGEYPPDLLIGEIKKIEKKESDVFQRAEIKPMMEYDKLINVFVIIFK